MAARGIKFVKGLTAPEGEILKVALLQQKSDAVTYADSGTSVTLFGHDPNIVLMGIMAVVGTKFNAAAKISIGNGTTANQFGVFQGSLRETGSYMKWLGQPLSSRGSVVATVDITSATTGSVRFYAIYTMANDCLAGGSGS